MSEEKEKSENLSNDGIMEGEVIQPGESASSEPASEISKEEYDLLAQDLQRTQTQAKEYFDGWQRERADFANYKRRIERDQKAMAQNITADVVKKYLAVLDDMERALKAKPDDGSAASWASGIELILRKLQNILDAENIRRIPAETELFDPTRHEAVTYEDSPDHESGQIIEVLQQGYTIGDRVIRPALVRVARG